MQNIGKSIQNNQQIEKGYYQEDRSEQREDSEFGGAAGAMSSERNNPYSNRNQMRNYENDRQLAGSRD